MASDVKGDLISLSDHVFQRTRNRIAGLTDDEYFWEPVADCWTVRRTDSGHYLADRTDPPEFTTIAWRLWHLAECYGGIRNPRSLGVERAPAGFERNDPAPATASDAIAELVRAHTYWRGVLDEMPAGALLEPLGLTAGPWAEFTKESLILHQLDEQIHHGAEIGVLRDLYQRKNTASSTDNG